jgi:hypothetical protein
MPKLLLIQSATLVIRPALSYVKSASGNLGETWGRFPE